MENPSVHISIFTKERFAFDGKAFYEFLVEYLKKNGYSGATVTRGIEGFGHTRVIHTSDLLEMSDDMPIVIDIIETAEKAKALLSQFREWKITEKCLITSCEVVVER